ncbi:4-hydroxybenzoate polyprenyl transferase [Fasciola hepatica]|uniref:4-hydroxybenzoate polyprenyltransferase, mitochondrial n=1 Tax=Fasciola hepatica TaxID=6192 RepID=A0A4E0R8Y6_FASHE|nr:4-hydroxybenzoate polyprenyl transferase [Fasciola hepatica]
MLGVRAFSNSGLRSLCCTQFFSHVSLHTSCPRSTERREMAVTPVPSKLNPYLRLARVDRPTGTWLLYLPCTWSIALAAPAGQIPDLSMLALFGVGAILMRGAGCTINDLWDRKFDRQVERTKDRPLASNELTPMNALIFLSIQLSAAFLVLLQLNWYSICVGCLSLVPVVIYPLFKRITYWPQFVLGITLNWGVWLGYSAVLGSCSLPICAPLYLAAAFWTSTYDTIYSSQDIEDDLLIGVKSTAILFGERTKTYLSLFHAGMLVNLLLVGVNSSAGWIYYAGTGAMMTHVAYLIYKTQLRDPKSCLQSFKASRTTGLIYFAAIVMDKLFSSTC